MAYKQQHPTDCSQHIWWTSKPNLFVSVLRNFLATKPYFTDLFSSLWLVLFSFVSSCFPHLVSSSSVLYCLFSSHLVSSFVVSFVLVSSCSVFILYCCCIVLFRFLSFFFSSCLILGCPFVFMYEYFILLLVWISIRLLLWFVSCLSAVTCICTCVLYIYVVGGGLDTHIFWWQF